MVVSEVPPENRIGKMKARNWLFLASFLLMLKGAMDISIYFVQYLSLGLKYIPTAPVIMHGPMYCVLSTEAMDIC